MGLIFYIPLGLIEIFPLPTSSWLTWLLSWHVHRLHLFSVVTFWLFSIIDWAKNFQLLKLQGLKRRVRMIWRGWVFAQPYSTMTFIPSIVVNDMRPSLSISSLYIRMTQKNFHLWIDLHGPCERRFFWRGLTH